jgi:hypothetical protein
MSFDDDGEGSDGPADIGSPAMVAYPRGTHGDNLQTFSCLDVVAALVVGRVLKRYRGGDDVDEFGAVAA